jgi:Tn3 transposase DDE domain
MAVTPDAKRFSQAMKHQFPSFRSYFHPSVQNRSTLQLIYHQRGELRQRYRQGQEDQLGVLGLVVNMIVLWNTWYLQDALDELQNNGQEARTEDVERIAPLSAYQCSWYLSFRSP